MKENKSKYGNKKVEIQGVKFDSEMEYKHYLYLQEQVKKGIVSEFHMQKRYVIFDGYTKIDGKGGVKVKPIEYIADFEVHYADGRVEVVDVKGFETTDFKLKKKLFEYRYPFELKLVTYSKIDGGWITLDELKKARKKRKELREIQKGSKVHGRTKIR